MQGTVDKVWQNERADGSAYWVLSIGGQRYSTWDGEMVAGVQKGDTVEFAFAQSGRYRNLTGLKRLAAASFTTAASIPPSPESLRIIRMNCLRTAAEMLKDTALQPEQKLCTVLAFASKLEEHVVSSACACDCECGGAEEGEAVE